MRAWLYNRVFRWLHKHDDHVRVWQEGEECSGCDKRCSGDCDDSLAEYWRECYITSLDEWVRARKEIGQLRARLVIDAPMVERAVRKWCGSGKSNGVTIDTLMRATLEAALESPAAYRGQEEAAQ